jgi:hypothetical protein
MGAKVALICAYTNIARHHFPYKKIGFINTWNEKSRLAGRLLLSSKIYPA